MERTITIKANIPEDVFMENILNQYYSGRDISLIFGLYALANSWKVDKLMYYAKLLKIK